MASCYHPLKAIDFGVADIATGKHNIKVLKGKFDPSEICEIPDAKYIPIPCGHCIGCRLQYSRQWADRCMLESLQYKNNIFLTLTYDNEHLPKPLEREFNIYDKDGDMIESNGKFVSPINPLRKRDIQLFIKRLRKEFPNDRLRYFACGEYGPRSMRPHYHLLIFNIPLRDLVFHHRDIDTGYLYYTSDTINRCWYPESDSNLPPEERSINGFHLIGNVTWETCAYTARYIVKKQFGKDADIYKKYNYPPEFTLMSRKPGIANEFFRANPDIVEKPFYVPTEKGHIEIHSNRYFDNLFDIDYPEELESIKEERVRISQLNEDMKANLTSLSYKERLAAEETYKLDQIKVLKRKEI